MPETETNTNNDVLGNMLVDCHNGLKKTRQRYVSDPNKIANYLDIIASFSPNALANVN